MVYTVVPARANRKRQSVDASLESGYLILGDSMFLLTEEQRTQMLSNGAARTRGEHTDPYPVLKLYTPDGDLSWVLSELDVDGDLAYGLIDVGTGFPELGLGRVNTN